MNRHLFAVLFSVPLIVSTTYADQRLFPTDILDKGEVDVLVSLGQTHSSWSSTFVGWGSAKEQFDQTEETVSVRYGLGSSVHIGVTAARNSTWERKTSFDGGGTVTHEDLKGNADPSLWAKYGFINDKQSPLSLAGEIRVTPDTADTGRGNGAVLLFGGYDYRNGLKGYATFSNQFPTEHRVPRTHTIAAGIFKEVSGGTTLTSEVYMTHFDRTSISNSTEQLGVNASAIVPFVRDFYLRPSITLFQTDSYSSRNELTQLGRVHGHSIAVSLYRLF